MFGARCLTTSVRCNINKFTSSPDIHLISQFKRRLNEIIPATAMTSCLVLFSHV